MSNYIDRRGDHMNERESYLEDRIVVLKARIKELEKELEGRKSPTLPMLDRLLKEVVGG